MKCIKENCDFYVQHDFNQSWFVCEACTVRPARLKDVDVKCLIEVEIRDRQDDLKILQATKENIEKEQ